MAQSPNIVFGDFNIDGIPASGAKKPAKSDIRELLTYHQSLLTAASYGNTVWFATKALLTADLAHAAGVPAVVYADATAANNGVYIKSGASGAGSWGQIITYLPGYQFVTATDAGAGSANVIVATSSPRVAYTDGVQLIRLNIFETNTSGAMTVAFDGGAALTIQTASGNAPAIGALTAGMTVLGVVDQSATVFRMLSDQASASIQAASEAALADFRTRWVGDFADDAAADAYLTGAGLTKAAGTAYFNTTSDVWKYWDGAAWQSFPYATVPDGTITTAKLAPDVSLNNKLVEVSFTDDHTVLLTDAGKVLAFEKATAVEATLPALSTTDDQRFIFLNLGVGTLTVTPDGSDTIPGHSPLELPTGALAELWVSADEGVWRARVILPSNGDEWVHFPRDVLAGGSRWTKVDLDGFRDVSIRGYARSSAEPAAFVLEFSRDNGASWDAGSNYTWHRVYGIDTVATAASDGDTSDPSINIGMSGSLGSGGGEGVRFQIDISDLSETLAFVQFQSSSFSTSGLYILGLGAGAHGGAGGARNGVSLRFTSGNMADGYVLAKALA